MALALAQVRDEYTRAYETAAVVPSYQIEIDRLVKKILARKQDYILVSVATGVPWGVVAIIHAREADCNFSCHLHNGDPLTARTRQVPAGRPRYGEPPFEWHDSAADALRFDHIDDTCGPGEWGIAEAAYAAETINGWGYRHRNVVSPYLWAGTTAYRAGKFTSDHVFDPNFVDKQPGAMAVLKSLLVAAPDALGSASSIQDQASSSSPTSVADGSGPHWTSTAKSSPTTWSLIGTMGAGVWAWITSAANAVADAKASAQAALSPISDLFHMLHINIPGTLLAGATLTILAIAISRHLDNKQTLEKLNAV